jgi:hypothetical protein
MPAVGKQRSGKNSRIQVAATNLRMATWKSTWQGDDLDTVNMESAGADQGLIGVIGNIWSLSGDWDASINSFDSPPGLYPRDDMGAIRFFENVADNVGHYLPTNRVISADNGAEAKGKVTFGANGKSQGVSMAVGLPTGSV